MTKFIKSKWNKSDRWVQHCVCALLRLVVRTNEKPKWKLSQRQTETREKWEAHTASAAAKHRMHADTALSSLGSRSVHSTADCRHSDTHASSIISLGRSVHSSVRVHRRCGAYSLANTRTLVSRKASRSTNISPKPISPVSHTLRPSQLSNQNWIERVLHNVFVRVHDGLVVVRTHVRTAKLDFRLFRRQPKRLHTATSGFSMLLPMALCVETLSLIRSLYRGWRAINDTRSHFSVRLLNITSEWSEGKKWGKNTQQQWQQRVAAQNLFSCFFFFCFHFFWWWVYLPRSSISSSSISSSTIRWAAIAQHWIQWQLVYNNENSCECWKW